MAFEIDSRRGRCYECRMSAIKMASVALLTSVALATSGAPIRAQKSEQRSVAFEVASVKVNTSGENRITIGIQPGGAFHANGAPLRELIGLAYGTPQPFTSFMDGGPKWMDEDRFDIIAKADHDCQTSPNGPPADFPPMLQSLLTDRFKLVVHHERRELPTYTLVRARSDGALGPQLHASTTDCVAIMAAARARGGAPGPLPPAERMACGMRMFPGALTGGAQTMAQLANALGRFVGRTVADRTGLAGIYDLALKWTLEQLVHGEAPPGAPPLPALIRTARQSLRRCRNSSG